MASSIIPLAVLGSETVVKSLERSTMGKGGLFSLALVGSDSFEQLREMSIEGVLVDHDSGTEEQVIAAIQLCRAFRPDVPVLVLTSTSGNSRRLSRAGAAFSLHKSGVNAAALRSVIQGASGMRANGKQEVARNAHTFAAAYEFSTDAILNLTTDGRILHCNAAAETQLGTKRDELLGKELATFAAPGHQSKHSEMLETVASGVPVSAFETVWCGRNGELQPMSLSAAPMRAAQDLQIGAVVVGRDTTNAKRTEELQRLASIGQLAAGVAHEINNPATFVRGSAEMLRDSLDKLRAECDSSQAEQLDKMRQMVDDCLLGVGRISAVVKDLSVFSRIEHDDVALTSVNDLVRNAAALAGNELRHRAELQLELGDVPGIALDRAKVAQVFLNLLVNAAHAVGDGSRADNVVRVETRLVDEQVSVVVSDTGCGIAPENLDRIFAPFFTTKPREHGTGLGLAISLETVRRHGGDIKVRTALNRGTEFEVTFPLRTALHREELRSKRRAASASKGIQKASAHPGSRYRVLVIDDEPLVRRSFRRFLASDHDVQVAEGGAQALAMLEAGERFDVILCDLMMPKIDGVAVWYGVQQVAPDLLQRMIFISGGAVTPHARSFLEKETPALMEKPIGRQELLSAVANAVADNPLPEEGAPSRTATT